MVPLSQWKLTNWCVCKKKNLNSKWKKTTEDANIHITAMSWRWHWRLPPDGFYNPCCCDSVPLSSVLLDGCPGRDATPQMENTVTWDAVENEECEEKSSLWRIFWSTDWFYVYTPPRGFLWPLSDCKQLQKGSRWLQRQP